MATNFLIIPRMTPPGSGEISVKFRPNVPYQVPMVDYTGSRVLQGSLVRFSVTTFPNFQLTSWKAQYYDDYGGIVDVPLTGIQGESTWEFTMPEHDVAIICEATSSDVYPSSGWNFPSPFIYTTLNRPFANCAVSSPQNFSSLDELVAALSSAGYEFRIDSQSFRNTINLYMTDNNTVAFAVVSPHVYIWLANVDYSVPFLGTVSYTIHRLGEGHWEFNSRSFYDNGYAPATDVVATEPHGIVGGLNIDTTTSFSILKSCQLLDLSVSPVKESSIQYILNPEDAGEVTQDSPTEFEQGTSDFVFRWRIKTGYSLRRITPFAVGDGPLEDDVVYSSTYDGETRTYTVTVQQIPNWAKGVRVLIECTNGNDPNVGGSSGVGGGNGTFDETSDRIPVEPMPSISAADAGMITLFRPTLSELKQLGAYLWTNIEDFIDNLKKMFSDPMDTIITLNILPGLPPVGTARNIRLGIWETDVSMLPVLSQWYELNFGTVRIDEFWGSALDYSPNTKISAMLPFIGSVQLDTDDVMGREVGLLYRIDLLSGHLVAMITINDDVIYQFTGECAVAVPLTGSDWSRVYGAIAGTLGAAAVGVAGTVAAGASAGVASNVARMGALKTAVAAGKEFRRSGIDAKGVAGVRTMRQQMLEATQQALDASADIARSSGDASIALKAGVAAHAANNVVGQIMSGKVSVAHSGTISGSAGLLGLRRPYIYIEYPNQSLPDGYKHFYGYPSNMRATLGELSGFTQCYQVLVNGFTGTDSEFGELLEALKEGVYL